MHRFHFHLFDWVHRLRIDSKELRYLYIHSVSRTFGFALVSIFIPIYLYRIYSQDLTPQHTLILIGIYYLILYLSRGLTAFVLPALFKNIGIKYGMGISLVMAVIGLVLLDYFLVSVYVLVLVSVLFGISESIYWASYHILFSRYIELGKIGLESTEQLVVIRFASFIAPVVGGFTIVFMSYGTLYFLSIVIALLSIYPIRYIHLEEIEVDFSFSKLKEFLDPSAYLAFFGGGFYEYSAHALWPLFLFMVLGGEGKVGALMSASLLFTILVLYFTGNNFDNKKYGGLFAFTTIFLFALWVARAFVDDPYTVSVIDFSSRIAEGAAIGSFLSYYYVYLRQDILNKDVKVLCREFINSVGGVSLSLILLLLLWVGLPFQVIFVFSALGLGMMYFISKA